MERTIAVDGTFLPATADVAWALVVRNGQHVPQRRARLDVQLSVQNWLPEVVVVASADQSESDSAVAHVENGKLYLYDRGFNGYALLNAHYRIECSRPVADASFVVRYRQAGSNAPALVDAEDRTLGDMDRLAGVVSDRVGRFDSSKPSRHTLLDIPLREVLVQYEAQSGIKTLRLITNLLDVSAAPAPATCFRMLPYRAEDSSFSKHGRAARFTDAGARRLDYHDALEHRAGGR